MSLSLSWSARIGVKLLLGMTQPPPAPLIDLGLSVYSDFITSLVETGEMATYQNIFTVSNIAWWICYVYCL